MEEIKNFIGGEFMPAVSGKWLSKECPATGKPYAKIPDSDTRDVEAAVRAARSAFPAWSAMPARERAKALRRLAILIEAHCAELAQAESIDSGKPLRVATQVDIPRSAYNFEFFADALTQFSSECHVTDGTAINYTVRSPLGVVGCISPWNLPLYLLTWKIAPALAAGNTVVAKPSEVTPMTAFLLARLVQEAEIPPGVLNIVHGTGAQAGDALVSHPEIAAISFTGSTRTGEHIARVTAPKFKKVSLEMGGKNPTIIFADCDFEAALDGALRAAFSNQGQICLCGSRIFVERPIYEKFKQALVDRTRGLKLGDPLEEAVDQGALVSRDHMEKVLSYISIAKEEGGKIIVGGSRARLTGRCERGYFVEPTIIEGLPSSSRINQEEIFGPVATLIPFDRESEVLEWANSTRYGLAASVWTQDLGRAHRVAGLLESGIVWVNCWMLRDLRTPFGGVKDSGVGREGGLEALRFFTEPKNICIRVGQ